MSAISSLYASPKTSMVSRDPDGIDPNSFDESVMRLEPVGSRADESVQYFLKSPSNGSNAENEGIGQPEKKPGNLNIAGLIGAPPPPPKTPPPKKAMKYRTQQNSEGRAGATPKTSNNAFMSFDDDSLLQSLARSSSSDTTASKSTEDLKAYSEDSSVKVDSPPRVDCAGAISTEDVDAVISPTSKIVEERVKAAMALYERDHLVIDDEEIFYEEVVRPTMATIGSDIDMVQRTPKTVESSPSKSLESFTTPKALPSPSSQATRPHSNMAAARTMFAKTSSSMSDSSRGAPSPRQVKELVKRQRQAQLKGRKEKKVNDMKDKKEQKRGFFKKIFGGRHKKMRDTSEDEHVRKDDAVLSPRRFAAIVSSPPNPSTRDAPGEEASSHSPGRLSSTSSSTVSSVPRETRDPQSSRNAHRDSLKPVLKSNEQRQYQGQLVESYFEQTHFCTHQNGLDSPTESKAVCPHSNNCERSGGAEFEYSSHATAQDPPDDEHGDPPEHPGRPLISPTSYNHSRSGSTSIEEDDTSRRESFKSRIAELYEENSQHVKEVATNDPSIDQVPSNLSHDGVDYFDDFSAITGAFGSKSFDPSSDELIETAQDHSQSKEHTREVERPDNNDDEKSYRSAKPNLDLQVKVQGPTQDPAGASPINWVHRGPAQANLGFRDPVGDSPMHGWETRETSTTEAPPLLGEFPSENEKKEDDDPIPEPTLALSSSSTESETPFEKDFKAALVGSTKNNDNAASNTRSTLKLKQVTGLDAIKEDAHNVSAPELGADKATFLHQKSGTSSTALDSTTASEKPATVPNRIHHYSTRSLLEAKRRASMAKAAKAIDKAKEKANDESKYQPKSANRTPKTAVVKKSTVDSMPQTAAEKKSTDNSTPPTNAERKSVVSSTPQTATEKKSLTVTTAAFTNAKAVAYLHQLHGQPSPRHTWHSSRRKHSEPSPLAARAQSRKEAKKKKQKKTISVLAKKPSPDEYSAQHFDSSLIQDEDAAALPRIKVQLEELNVIKAKEGAMFGAYSSKFQGRKPSKKKETPEVATPSGSRLSLGSRGRQSLEPCDKMKPYLDIEVKPGRITGWAVSKGIRLRRSKRDNNVANGLSERVILTPRARTEGRNRFNFFPHNEAEIKDPIQRAGRRILSKAAIPIQTAARRYIAKREAIDRMWALIEIQSYYRRWRAEANLQATIHSAVIIQRFSRGWLTRQQLGEMIAAATQIQRIVRGYICQVKVYDTMYYVVRLQALLRGCYLRQKQSKQCDAATQMQRYLRGFRVRRESYKARQAIPFQALYRGHKARQEYAIAIESAKLIQTTWRSYSSRITYQIEIVDIIISQSVVRRWLAHRRAQSMRDAELFGPASIIQAIWRGKTARDKFRKNTAARTLQAIWRGFQVLSAYKEIIAAVRIQAAWNGFLARREYCKSKAAKNVQAVWRGHCAREEFKKNVAAKKIQAVWRGFQSYTDYIFALVDILIIQRNVRKWISMKKADQMRQDNAVTKIQSSWRRHRAQSTLLHSLVHIIVVQSVARRFLVQKTYRQLKDAQQKRISAAISIQKVWRGFWSFSHYIIVQYEVCRLQALVRGKIARQSYHLQLGCAIIIQATMRRHLAKKSLEKRMISNAVASAEALSLRERNSAKKIQFWWRIVMDWTKEKKAALTIERFFIHVRAEVDREIMRRERRKHMKKEKRRSRRRQSDEHLLERAWLNTVDENSTMSGISRDARGEMTLRSQSAPRMREGNRSSTPRRSFSGKPTNGLISPKPSSIGQEVDIHGWPIQYTESLRTPASRPPTDSVRMAASEDSEVSNITNPSIFNRLNPTPGPEVSNITNPSIFNRLNPPPGRCDAPGRSSSKDRRMSTDDYIKKYGSGGGNQTAPNRMTATGKPRHFFSDDASVGSSKVEKPAGDVPVILPSHPHVKTSTPRSVPPTPTSARRSSSTPRGYNDAGPSDIHKDFLSHSGRSKSSSSVTTPRKHLGSSTYQVPSPRIQVGFPPVTPRSNMHGGKQYISRGDTAETESQTTYSQNSFSKASPRSRNGGYPVHRAAGHAMNTKRRFPTNLSLSYSDDGEQEVLFLNDEGLGEEYGEV